MNPGKTTEALQVFDDIVEIGGACDRGYPQILDEFGFREQVRKSARRLGHSGTSLGMLKFHGTQLPIQVIASTLLSQPHHASIILLDSRSVLRHQPGRIEQEPQLRDIGVLSYRPLCSGD